MSESAAATGSERRRQNRRKNARGLVLWLVPVLVVVGIQWGWRPVIVQLTSSAPRGIWLRVPGEPGVGSTVAFPAPEVVDELLVAAGYPRSATLLKRVAASDGDLVDGRGDRLRINGEVGGLMDRRTSKGVEMPAWRASQRLTSSEVWVSTEAPTGVDSRNFGPLPRAWLEGTYKLFWTWE